MVESGVKFARKKVRPAKGFILASTTGGNDFRSVLRVLISVACAICGVLLMVLMTAGLDERDDLIALLPALGGVLGGALGMYLLAPRLIAQPPSHFLEFRGDTLRIHIAEGDSQSFRNANLEAEHDPGARFPSALTVKGRRFELVACYTEVDEERMQAHLRSGQGLKFRSPRIELRAHKGMLQAVRIVASGRYSSREEPFY